MEDQEKKRSLAVKGSVKGIMIIMAYHDYYGMTYIYMCVCVCVCIYTRMNVLNIILCTNFDGLKVW